MNKLIFVFFLSCCMMSCVSRTAHDELVSQLDSLKAVNQEQEQINRKLTSYLDTLSLSLDSLIMPSSVQLLSQHDNDGLPLSYRQINKNLDEYERILSRQREKLESLQDTVIAQGGQISKLKALVTYLTKQLDEKESQIETMRKEIAMKNREIRKLNSAVAELNAKNDTLRDQSNAKTEVIMNQEKVLSAQSSFMNQAYVFIGTYKEIQDAGMISNLKFSIANCNEKVFERIDIRQFRSLSINATKVKVMSQMPKDSYTLTKDESGYTLQITNPVSFWGYSRYLVIQTSRK